MMDIDKIFENQLDDVEENIFGIVNTSINEARELQKKKVAENVHIVINALKKIEQNIRNKYDVVGSQLEKRILSIKDGRNGIDGRDGKDGKDGKNGKDGKPGKDGINGKDGVDGQDGVSVINANIDFDGSLVISLSNGREINVGEVMPLELAERIKVITNGGGTSQSVLDTLASLQAQITALSTSITTATLNVTGNTTLGDASTDTVRVNGYMGVGVAPNSGIGVLISNTALTGTTQRGVVSNFTATSSATSVISAFQSSPGTAVASFTVTDVIGLRAANVTKGAGSTITNQHGIYIDEQNQGTNNYGITSLVTSGANKYNIYASGTAQNYFAGDVGIGTNAPANRLDIVNSASSAQMSIAGSDGQFAGMFGGTGSNGPGIFFLNTAPALRFGTATTKALGSFTELMRLTAGGNLGLGVTPSSWGAGNKAFEQIGGFLFSGAVGNIYLGNNTYFDGTNWIYKNTAAASYYQQGAGAHYWFQAASGTAGNTITFTERMRLDSSGNLGIGTTSAGDRLSLGGAIRVTQDGSSVGVYLAGGMRHTGSSNFYIDSNTGGAAGNIIFRNGSGFAEQMRLSSSGNLGIGTASPVNKLQVVGSFGRGAPVTKTGNFTLADTENWIICNGTGTITVTLPAASSWSGREFTIKTIAAFTVISNASNVVPLAGGAAGTAILADTAGTWATLVSDGTNWIIMQA